jgi:hypothetical protein
MQHKRLDSVVPEGREWLLALQTRILGACVASTDHFITSDRATSEQVDYLGTVLSLLDRLSSCYWGCHSGDHTKEYLLGRACTSTSAAWIMVQHGHYDAALGIARDIGEIANLLMLFGAEPNAFTQWKDSDDRARMRNFKPSEVRKRLEQLNVPVPVGKDIYKVLRSEPPT